MKTVAQAIEALKKIEGVEGARFWHTKKFTKPRIYISLHSENGQHSPGVYIDLEESGHVTQPEFQARTRKWHEERDTMAQIAEVAKTIDCTEVDHSHLVETATFIFRSLYKVKEELDVDLEYFTPALSGRARVVKVQITAKYKEMEVGGVTGKYCTAEVDFIRLDESNQPLKRAAAQEEKSETHAEKMSRVMSRAWAYARRMAADAGQKIKEAFSAALRQSWAEEKSA